MTELQQRIEFQLELIVAALDEEPLIVTGGDGCILPHTVGIVGHLVHQLLDQLGISLLYVLGALLGFQLGNPVLQRLYLLLQFGVAGGPCCRAADQHDYRHSKFHTMFHNHFLSLKTTKFRCLLHRRTGSLQRIFCFRNQVHPFPNRQNRKNLLKIYFFSYCRNDIQRFINTKKCFCIS
ncbi:MAG: hypothetical protein BWY71_00548 [Planctomycetes bacterium ADurb.Bin412]|nr:MAG: hypothetical protein BWY71_00548 [Planctomycetes bacterium ADurb.Bin412]